MKITAEPVSRRSRFSPAIEVEMALDLKPAIDGLRRMTTLCTRAFAADMSDRIGEVRPGIVSSFFGDRAVAVE